MDNLVAIFQAHLKSDFSLLVLALCYLGGLVASLSPCGIGVLPVVVSYIGGYSKEKTSNNRLANDFFSARAFIVPDSCRDNLRIDGKSLRRRQQPLLGAVFGFTYLHFRAESCRRDGHKLPSARKKLPAEHKTQYIHIPNAAWSRFCPCNHALLNPNPCRNHGDSLFVR